LLEFIMTSMQLRGGQHAVELWTGFWLIFEVFFYLKIY
jgi:hypothetical protein